MKIIKMLKGSGYGSVAKNTAMLVIMHFSNMIMTFWATGHQTQIFGKQYNGILGSAATWMMIFQLIMDFGFMISATGKISASRDDPVQLRRIFTRVLLAKLSLIAVAAAIMGGLIAVGFITISGGTELLTYWLYLLSTALMAMLPDFFFRGVEKMSVMAVRAVSVKLLYTVLIFIFVKKPTDYFMVPLFTIIGNAAALVLVYHYLFTKIGIRFVKVSFQDVLREIKESGQFFLSRIASTVYGSVNAIILEKLLDPTKTLSGYYKSAELVTSAARNGVISPIADSLYPHTMRHKKLKILKKAILLLTPVVAAGCGVVGIFADRICPLWLGPEVGPEVVAPLRALLPTVVISVPNYLLGFPAMSPLGLAKKANISINFGTVFHIMGLVGLYLAGSFTLVSVCVLTSFTELLILLYRVGVLMRYYRAARVK